MDNGATVPHLREIDAEGTRSAIDAMMSIAGVCLPVTDHPLRGGEWERGLGVGGGGVELREVGS